MADAGDEAARDAWNVLQQLLEWMISKAGEALGCRVSLPALRRRADKKTKEIRESDASLRADDRQGEDLDNCLTVCAADADDLALIAAELDANDVYYAVDPECLGDVEHDIEAVEAIRGVDGLFRLYVPEECFDEAPDHIQDMILANSYGEVVGRLGFQAACAESAPLPEVDFAAGKRSNIRLGFSTVKWDPEGALLTDSLNDRGIAFEQVARSEGGIEVEIAREHAPWAMEVIDGLNDGRIRAMGEGRFAGLDDLKEAARAKDVILTREVQGEGNVEATRAALEQAGIAYSCDYDILAQAGTFAVSAQQMAAKGELLPRSPEELHAAQAARMLRTRDAERATRSAEPVEGFREQLDSVRRQTAANRSTPARDEAAARRSAAAQTRDRDLTRDAKRAR